MTNFFDVAHAHSTPSNKNSAMANSGGLSYSPSYGSQEDFDTPPAYWFLRDLPDYFNQNQANITICASMYGLKNFRLTVLGLAKDMPKKKTASRFACKCSCGMFCLRTAKQMKSGTNQACGVCRANFVRVWREMGGAKKATENQVWQRMGGA